MNIKAVLLIGTILMQGIAFAQSGQISGSISHKAEALEAVKVWVEGSQIAAFTDDDGRFELTDVPEGKQIIKASLIGYKTASLELEVLAKQMNEVSFEMIEDVFGVDQVVISASRNEQSRKDAAVIVNVIDDRLFTATQSVSLAEGLSFQPGLRMETNCQNCGFSQVRMNGLEGAYSQILIDGRPTFSALNSIYGLEQIPTNMIERVEVIRGGGSALYGSNAIAGTINIITKDPIRNDFQLGTYYSVIGEAVGDRAVNVNASLVSPSLKTGISVFGMYRNRAGYDHNADGFSEIPVIHNNNFGFKAFYRPELSRKLSIEFHSMREYRRGGDQLELKPHQAEIAEELRSDVLGGSISYEQYSQDLRHKIALYSSAQTTKMDNYYGGGQDIEAYGNTEDLSIVAGGLYTFSFADQKAILTTGAEYKYNDMLDEKPGYNLFVDQQLHLMGVYAQQEWRPFERLKLLGGLRYDYNNLTKKWLLNPRANVLYDVRTDLQVRASYARGFRAPQIFTDDIHVELVGGEIQAIRLDEGLESETSDSYMLSLDYSPNFGSVQSSFIAEGFVTRLSNPFILEEIPTTGFPILEKRNGSAATVAGVNLEAKIAPIPSLQFQSSFTIQRSRYDEAVEWSADTESKQSVRDFLRTPNLYGNFVLNWQAIKKLRASLSAVYTGSMLVPHFAGYIEADRLEETPDFFELNMRVGYDVDVKDELCVEFYGGVQNMLNAFQRDFDLGADRDAGYVYGPSRPRSIFVGLKLQRAE